MEEGWSRRVGDRVIRHPRQQDLEPIHIPVPAPRKPGRRFESPLVVMYAFGSLIAVGTFLLWLPFFNTTKEFAPFMTALFTATSASTVTGLVTVDTSTFWTRGGQAVIMGLILVGGLGFMSTATFLLVVVTQRITLSNQLIMREFLGVSQFSGLMRLTIQIVTVAMIFQIAGFGFFFWRFLPLFETNEAVWQAAFLSISSFNNAGFNIFPESASLAKMQKETWILGISAILIILGGVSYSVLVDLLRFGRFKRFTIDSRLVLVTSLALWLVGGLVIFTAEFNNPGTLGPLSVGEKATNALFMTISGRTAGFTTIDLSQAELHTNVFLIGLMFIGGASGSVAGGIKVNTFAIIVIAVLASIRGSAHVEVFGREIPDSQIQRALTIAFLAIAFIFIIGFLLVITEQMRFPFDQLIFETVSAFGTGGLSTGITPALSVWGKTLLVFTMFVGRIGPLTIALALGQRPHRAVYRYSQERVRIG